MKCQYCKGQGYTVYDTDPATCSICLGDGRLSLIEVVRLKSQALAMRIEGTQLERLYWRWILLPHKARCIAKIMDIGDLEQRLEQRKERSKKIAALVEAGLDAEMVLRREWRLIAEAERAIAAKRSKGAR